MKPNKAKAGGTFIERETYQSRAFNSLSKNGMKVMIAFWDQRIFKKIKGKKSQCINADHLKLPYGLLQRTYGIPRGRIPKAIDELLAKGFIRIVHAGGSAKSDLSIYALSDHWRLWRQGSKPFSAREPRQHHGYQGRPVGAVAAWKGKSANIGHEREPIHAHETEPIPAN